MSLPRVACVVGPTASGKSAVSELVALELGSSVVSVDAMQVYRGMDVGTAKMPVAERRAPLLMVDVADPLESYSVQLFQEQARACVDALLAEGRLPVLAGGTGLYLNAVIDEMSFPSGEKDDERRRSYEALAAERGPEGLYALLAERDPDSAGLIHPNNVRRVVRALEMLDEGVSYARHHEGLHERRPHYDARIWGLTMARERLYARIDERVDIMVKSGLCAEIGRLAPDFSWQSMQAIGYKEFAPFADRISDGKIRLDRDEVRAVAELIKKHTRNYAKRQLTWFRRYPFVKWFELGDFDGAEQYVIGRLKAAK